MPSWTVSQMLKALLVHLLCEGIHWISALHASVYTAFPAPGRQVALSLLRLPIEECLHNQIACHSQDDDNTAYCLSHILDLLI